MRGFHCATWILLCTWAAAAAASEGTETQADSRPAERAQEILSSSKYQTELPLSETKPPPEPPRSTPNGLPIARLLLYGILAAAVIAILMILFQYVQERLRLIRERQGEGVGARSGPSQGSLSSLEEIEKMAAAGRLAEAVHLLLQRAFELLAGREDGQLQDSMTGREVLNGVGLQPDARDALRHLVDIVERSFFGGLPVDMRDFHQCRTSYAVLAASLAIRER